MQEANVLDHIENNSLKSEDLKRMIQTAAGWLEKNKETVDRMNVFPVPDGDTGTNMALTMHSAEKFASRVNSQKVSDVAEQMAYGALMGARGNSGVILSQILAGMASVLQNHEEITSSIFSKAMRAGAEYAYRAVSNPMEGTILTVVREIAEDLVKENYRLANMTEMLEQAIQAGYASLNKTPELLPVLKQAGVKDAGGQGLIFILEGFLYALTGKELDIITNSDTLDGMDIPTDNVFDHFFDSVEDIIYPYCTEFLVHTEEKDLQNNINQLKEHYDSLGDCMLVVGSGKTIKVHIHTEKIGDVLGFAGNFGELDDIKINNMRSQHHDLQSAQGEEESDVAIIAVTSGQGFVKIFESLGVAKIIAGGQTMNPSTEDFLNAIDEVKAKQIFILPNNKNIILAAEQAVQLTESNSIHVIPTRTMPQGISALLEFSPEESGEVNKENMIDGMNNVTSGELTTAVRDTSVNDILIKTGQYMGIVDGKIRVADDSREDVLQKTIEAMAENDDKEFFVLYFGGDLIESEADAHIEALQEFYPDLEFELHAGGQAVYDYIISAE